MVPLLGKFIRFRNASDYMCTNKDDYDVTTFVWFDDDSVFWPVFSMPGYALLEDKHHIEHGQQHHAACGDVESHEAVIVPEPKEN